MSAADSKEALPPPSSPESNASPVKDVEDNGAPATKEDQHIYVAETLSTPRQILFIATVCMAMFTNQLGLGNTVGIVGIIGKSFGLNTAGEQVWLLAGYSLSIGTFILIAGRLGDEFGHKRLFVIGMAWYALWSLIAGLAVYSSYVLFIFARVFQGMGPAMTLPSSLAILGSSYSPGPRKNMAFAWFGGTAPFGAIAGFTFGGLFSLAWWPWTYWSQAIALAALAAFGAWVIPDQPLTPSVKQQSWHDKMKFMDVPGCVTGVASLVLFNFAWNEAVVVGWEQPYVYVCLILGVLFGAVFFGIEAFWAPNPIIPFAAFNVDIFFIFGCTAAGWATFGIWVFYFAQLVMQIRGISPLLLAAWYSPVIPSGLLSALAVGKTIGKLPASWIMVVGQLAYVVGSILAATMPVHSNYWTYFFFSVIIICVGMDSSFPAATVIFSDAVPPKYQGIGASVVMTIVNYSISLGLGFAGTAEREVKKGADGLAGDLLGIRAALWVSVGLAGLGLVLSLLFVAKEHFLGRASVVKT
ncbi:MFS general substrate transporter [Periconia macrospinosa]|uniref:MFS general substrate transporter n=1 Tax=Periconia macrospinosa TaxID=97972 RepID=A0A2V1D4A9_9PLEO|nr:MFS general substrate transporter [Periconia macrospinosa]